MPRVLFPFTLALVLVTGVCVSSQEPAPATSDARDVADLQIGIWRALASGAPDQAEAHSRRLLELDPGNALACATLLLLPSRSGDSDATLTLGRSGLRSVHRLSRLPGMSEDEFGQMMRRVRIILNSAVGRTYLERGDQVTARKYLKEAVALDPGNAQHAYIAGQAFLNGKHPDLTVGYWLLARSVVLTQGTKSGEAIARYAYSQYMSAGGKREDWSTFLARASQAAPPIGIEVAAIPARPVISQTAPAASASGRSLPSGSDGTAATVTIPTTSASVAGPTSQSRGAQTDSIPSGSVPSTPRPSSNGAENTAVLSANAASPSSSVTTPPQSQNQQSASPATRPNAAATVPVPPQQRTSAAASSVASSKQQDLNRIEDSLPQSGRNGEDSDPIRSIESGSAPSRSLSGSKAPELPVEIAENRTPDLPPPPIGRPKLREGAPISIGVLIQAHIASKENRQSVVYALSDMLRHLRDSDEAFVVSYAKGVGIEQDLTWNYDMLEKAMDRITPDPGAQLYDAVGFSAGHLARVAKNPDRVLLVISDGTSDLSNVSSLELDSELRSSAARVYCIGIGVNGTQERWRLENLAARYGGEARFVQDPSGFRPVMHDIAAHLGIDFQE